MDQETQKKVQELMQQAMMGSYVPQPTMGWGLMAVPTFNFAQAQVSFAQPDVTEVAPITSFTQPNVDLPTLPLEMPVEE